MAFLNAYDPHLFAPRQMGRSSEELRGGKGTFIIRNGPVESFMQLRYSREYFTHRKTASIFGLKTKELSATQDREGVYLELPNHEYEP